MLIKNTDNNLSPTNTLQNETEEIIINPNKKTYLLCSQEEKALEKKVGSTSISYQYILKYEFSIYQKKITGGSLIEECIFKNLEDYQTYLQLTTISDNSSYQKNENKDNLTITYQMYSILHSTPSLDYSDDYLEKLEKDGFTCKITAEL